MHDYFLKFDSKEQADKFLAQYKNDKDNVAIDPIGTLYNQIDTGEIDEEGFPIYTSEAKQGYHVNIRSRYEIECEYQIDVKTPDRVFA